MLLLAATVTKISLFLFLTVSLIFCFMLLSNKHIHTHTHAIWLINFCYMYTWGHNPSQLYVAMENKVKMWSNNLNGSWNLSVGKLSGFLNERIETKIVRVFYHKQYFHLFQLDPHYNLVKWIGRLAMITPILQRVWVCSRHSVVSNPLWPQGLKPTRLLCPLNFPGKNTVTCCHFLLQGYNKVI